MAKEEDKYDDDANITCFPSISVLNADVGASPLLPVNIDSNLAHIKFIIGSKNTKVVPITALWYLIDSGAGAIIGFLDCFEGIIILNNLVPRLARAVTWPVPAPVVQGHHGPSNTATCLV